MARQPRLVVAGQPHHVYLRGNNRRVIFSSKADFTFFVACLRRALDATRCQLHQLTLMRNHVHSIITPPDEDAISSLVKRACQRYSQDRNQKRGASGKLFEERYRSKIIVDDAQLMTTTLYNDANAYKAGEVTDPFVHEWSTVPLHAGVSGARLIRSLWTPSRWYLRLGRTEEERVLAYRREKIAYLELAPATIDDAIALDAKAEAADAERYVRRLERPNRSSAREPELPYRGKRLKGS
jgi:REP-associated tyrosine transposase